MKDQQIYLTGAVPVVSIVSAPWVAASYHGIFRTELQVSRALRVGNSINRKRLKFWVQYVCISWLMIWGDPLNF